MATGDGVGFSKARTEKACAVSWFQSWSAEQREKFLARLLETTSVDLATEAMMMELEAVSLGGRPEGPGVFDCQLKQEFVAELCNSDPEFKIKLETFCD